MLHFIGHELGLILWLEDTACHSTGWNISFLNLLLQIKKDLTQINISSKKSYDFKVRRNLQNLQKHPSSFLISSVMHFRSSTESMRLLEYGWFGLRALEEWMTIRLTWLNCIRFGSDMRLRDDTFHYENEYHQRTIDWSNYNVRSHIRRSLTYSTIIDVTSSLWLWEGSIERQLKCKGSSFRCLGWKIVCYDRLPRSSVKIVLRSFLARVGSI